MNTCDWKEDEEGNWHTDCDNIFVLTNGGPQANGMEFCCYCGERLKEVLFEPRKEEEK